MMVFISWSGSVSRQLAEALRDWLPLVIQAVEPYVSSLDNEAGVRWNNVVSSQLDSTNFGILCLTPDNLESPWLHFEAGALGKSLGQARVAPLLHELTPTDITAPLNQFHMKTLDREGVRGVVESINSSLPDRRLSEGQLANIFETMWPRLEAALRDVRRNGGAVEVRRSDRAILEEILDLARGLSQRKSLDVEMGVAPPDRWAQELSTRADAERLIRAILGPPGNQVRFLFAGSMITLYLPAAVSEDEALEITRKAASVAKTMGYALVGYAADNRVVSPDGPSL